jgi:hypothetical protein
MSLSIFRVPLSVLQDGEGEHAAEMVDAVRAPFLIGMEDDLGVGAGAEAVAMGLQFPAQVEEVVDFAVVDDPAGFVLIGDGLVAGGEVNDAEAGHGQGGIAEDHGAGVVGAAVGKGGVHAFEGGPFIIGCGTVYPAANATHIPSPL